MPGTPFCDIIYKDNNDETVEGEIENSRTETIELLDEEDRETNRIAMVDLHCTENDDQHEENVMRNDTDDSDDEHYEFIS